MKRTIISLFISTTFTTPVMAEALYTFDDVVVSATRTKQENGDVSSSIAIVEREALDKQLVQDLRDAVKHEPGIQVEGQGRFGFTGFNIRGREANHVKVLVDGVEQAASYDPGADVMKKSSTNAIEMDTLKQIEINKGPASSLYGSDAVAGAVMMTTLDPQDLLQGEATYFSVKSGYNDVNDSFKTTAKLAGQTETLEALLIYTHRQGHETKTHANGADIEGRDRGQADPFSVKSDNVLAKVYFTPSDQHRLGLALEHYQSDSVGELLSNNGYTMMPSYTYTDNRTNDRVVRDRVTLSHLWEIEHRFFDDLHWQLSWQQSDVDNNTFDTTEAKGQRQRQRQGMDESWQGQWQFNKSLSAGNSEHLLSYGLSVLQQSFQLNYQDISLDNNAATSKNPEVPNADSFKWGAYVQHQGFFLNERLITNMALRFDAFTAEPQGAIDDILTAKENAWTGKFGAVYHWNEAWSTFGQFSQGFKAPTLYDMYYQYEMGEVIIPNPNLRPERSNAFEIGQRWQGEFGRFSFSGFYNFYNDFIERVYIGMDESGTRKVSQNVNIAKAKIYGVEWRSDWDLNAALSLPQGSYLTLSAAYAKGENSDTGAAIDSVAPLSGTLTVGFDAPSTRFGTALTLQAVAGKSDDDWSDPKNMTASGYSVFDITAYYRPVADLTLRAGLFNAFDKQYWLYSHLDGREASDTQGLNRDSQPGRHWGLEAEYLF